MAHRRTHLLHEKRIEDDVIFAKISLYIIKERLCSTFEYEISVFKLTDDWQNEIPRKHLYNWVMTTVESVGDGVEWWMALSRLGI